VHAKDDRTRSFPPSEVERLPRARTSASSRRARIYEHLDRYVIGQTSAKRAVATAAHQHLKRIEQRRQGKATLLRKSNVLLMGPTGSGKTHIARKLAELLECRSRSWTPLNIRKRATTARTWR